MIATIVKIDLVGSKSVSAAHQLKNPAIRKQLLEKLIEISKSRFPQSDQKFPAGSFYKAEGDAAYFILDKPTVALRATIEFMQSWFNVRLPDLEKCPDCRIMIDRGDIQTVDTPAGDDFVSAAFENIAVAEKGLQGGGIYASSDVVENCDRTLARFTSYSSVQPRHASGAHDRLEWARVNANEVLFKLGDDRNLLLRLAAERHRCSRNCSGEGFQEQRETTVLNNGAANHSMGNS